MVMEFFIIKYMSICMPFRKALHISGVNGKYHIKTKPHRVNQFYLILSLLHALCPFTLFPLYLSSLNVMSC